MEQSIGGRYGIWGVIPREMGPDIGERAMSTAKGVSELFSKAYGNKLERLKAQQAERTLESAVKKANATNLADAEYYPQELQGKIGLNKAHMGYFGAQSDEARARAEFERMRAGLGIAGLQAMHPGINIALGNGTPQIDPVTGKVTSVETGTMASKTADQLQLRSEAGLKKIGPLVIKGAKVYAGPLGWAKHAADLAIYKEDSTEGRAAKDRLITWDLAKRMRPEYASIVARMSQGQAPGIEAINEFKTSTANNLFSPADIQQASLDLYNPTQEGLVNAEVDTERGDFQHQNPTPPYLTNQIISNPMQQGSRGMSSSGGREGVIGAPLNAGNMSQSPALIGKPGNSPQPTEEQKGLTMENINALAQKYNMSPEQVIERLRKGGG